MWNDPRDDRSTGLSWLTLSALATILFFMTFFVLGYYYYWIDDPLVDNFFRGLFLAEPANHFFTLHILLSKLYAGLYSAIPGIPWFGIFFGIYIFIATVSLFYFISESLSHTIRISRSKWILILILFYLLVVIEHVFLMNISRTSLMLMGSAYLNIHLLIKRRIHLKGHIGKWVFFTIAFMVGLLGRPELVYILLPILLTYSFADLSLQPGLPKRFGTILALFVGLFLVYKAIDYTQITEEIRSTREFASHALNINDGQNHTGFEGSDDMKIKTKLLSCFLYFFPDEEIINQEFLDAVGPRSTLSLETLQNLNIGDQLYTEYYKARFDFPKDYLRAYNWFWKSVGFIIFNLLLTLVTLASYFRKKAKASYLAMEIIMMAAVISLLFVVTLLFKMEDRVLTPVLTVFTLAHLVFWMDNDHHWRSYFRSKAVRYTLLSALLICLFIRITGYLQIKSDKRKELQQKAILMDEINNDFDDKMIFYDMWTMALMHQTPLHMNKLKNNNMHLAYGEHWSNFFDHHVVFLNDLCGSMDFSSFYHCLYERRQDVVFLYVRERKELIELYSRVIYGENLNLKKIKTDSELYNLEYSFIWMKLDFGYYTFDDSFEDDSSSVTDLPTYFEWIYN